MDLEYKKTERGFTIGNFTDMHGIQCSLQDSSLATKNAIWFGANQPNPRDKHNRPIVLDETVSFNTRMHLIDLQVDTMILPLLRYFIRNGNLQMNHNEVPFSMDMHQTQFSGSHYFSFKDYYSIPCEIREEFNLSHPMIWIGCSDNSALHCIRGSGWLPVRIPDLAHFDSGVYMDQSLAEKLVRELASFVKHGILPFSEKSTSSDPAKTQKLEISS